MANSVGEMHERVFDLQEEVVEFMRSEFPIGSTVYYSWGSHVREAEVLGHEYRCGFPSLRCRTPTRRVIFVSGCEARKDNTR